MATKVAARPTANGNDAFREGAPQRSGTIALLVALADRGTSQSEVVAEAIEAKAKTRSGE
jgi:hypothetical protein